MASYIVKSGDTLSAIAKRLGLNWRDLYNLNKKTIGGNPNLIRPGQKLTYGSISKTEAKPKVDAVAELAKGVTGSIKKQGPTFEQLYGSEQKFIREQEPLARQGVAQQTQSQFLPQIDEGIANIRSAFASRGLFRSGIRGREETKFLRDIAEEEAKTREQLYSIREKELGSRYGKMQSDYEKALEQGVQYKAPTELTSYNVTTNRPFQPTGEVAKTRYSPLGAYTGADSSSRFGEAYRRWYEDRFKKIRPDVSYNY